MCNCKIKWLLRLAPKGACDLLNARDTNQSVPDFSACTNSSWVTSVLHFRQGAVFVLQMFVITASNDWFFATKVFNFLCLTKYLHHSNYELIFLRSCHGCYRFSFFHYVYQNANKRSRTMHLTVGGKRKGSGLRKYPCFFKKINTKSSCPSLVGMSDCYDLFLCQFIYLLTDPAFCLLMLAL